MLRFVFVFLMFGSSLILRGENNVRNIVELKHDSIDKYIEKAIADKYFPGAQLVIGTGTDIIYSRCYGYHDYGNTLPVTDEDVYDIASCTKVMSATVAVMKLVSEGRLALTDKLGSVVPEYSSSEVGKLTLSELMKHTSGMKSSVSVTKELVESANSSPLFTAARDSLHPYRVDSRLYMNKDIRYNSNYVITEGNDNAYQIGKGLFLTKSFRAKLDSLVMSAYNPQRRGSYRYSDLNFYFIGAMIESVTGKTLDRYTEELYAQLDIQDMGFKPLEWKNEKRIVPTEFDCLIRRDTVCGYVHDELAAVSGGVSGNAGLFANALSMAKMCAMFLNKGDYNGKSIIPSDVIFKFTTNQVSGSVFRGYGFDKQNPASSPYSAESYGHTGFTGTYFWVDPKKDVYVILLTNRIHPSRLNTKLGSEYRSELWRMVTQ